MADFTVHIPDSYVARLVDPVDQRLAAIENLDVTQKYLAWLGAATIADLTPNQRPEVVCGVFLWQLSANMVTDEAGQTAREEAYQGEEDDFVLE